MADLYVWRFIASSLLFVPLEVEQDRRRDQRARQAAAAGLVGAGHEPGSERAIELEQAPASRARGGFRAAPEGAVSAPRPIRFGGQYVKKATPMTHLSGTGPQKRLSSDSPRLSPIMK